MKTLHKITAALFAAFAISGAAFAGPVVVLNWSDNSTNEEGFIVERALPGAEFVEIGRTAENVSTYQDLAPELKPGQTVVYRVQAFNSFGVSGYTNEASHRLKADRFFQPIDGDPSGIDTLQVSSLTINAQSVTVIEK